MSLMARAEGASGSTHERMRPAVGRATMETTGITTTVSARRRRRVVPKTSAREAVRDLLDTHGRTYADQAHVHLRNTPQPLYQLLVLSCLLSAPIRSDTAVASCRALSDAGLRDARRMADATWQERVDALGKGGYRRYDERTATQLGEGAELLLDEYHGDLRYSGRELTGTSTSCDRCCGRCRGSAPSASTSSCGRCRGSGRKSLRTWTGRPSRGRAKAGCRTIPRRWRDW